MCSWKEFKALSNIHPANLAQAEWICRAIDKFTIDHPELQPRIERYYQKSLEQVLGELTEIFSIAVLKTEAWNKEA